MKIVAMKVSSFMISLVRRLTLERCRSIRPQATSRSTSSMSISWNTWSAAVPQVDPGGRADEGGLVAQKVAHDLAHRPERAAQFEQIALEAVDADDEFRVGLLHDLALQSLERLAEVLEHRKIAVDQSIQQRVGQKVGAQGAHPRVVLTQPRAHRVEAVAGALLEGEDEVLADDQGQLLGAESHRRGGASAGR